MSGWIRDELIERVVSVSVNWKRRGELRGGGGEEVSIAMLQ